MIKAKWSKCYHFGEKVSTPKEALAGFHSSFQDAYEASGSQERALNSYWEGRKAYTRYNLKKEKLLVSLINELITGYGMKPLRPLVALGVVCFVATLLFSFSMPLNESMIFSAGALFTFGAAADHLKEFGFWGRLFYISLSFCGISLSGLFITCLANLWFRSKIPFQTIKTPYT
jgi:hypothetical protein